MNHKWYHKLTALLLVFAMSLSLTATAAAAELDTAAEIPQEVTGSEPETSSDSSSWDTLPTEDAANTQDTEPETDPADAAEPGDSSTGDAGEASSAPDASAPEAPASEETEEPSGEEELPTEELPVVEPADAQEDGWSYALSENGALTFSFSYTSNGQLVKAADGFFLLPEDSLVVTTETGSTTYHFQAGIYSFDKDGIWLEEMKEETASVSLTAVEEKDGALVSEGSDEKVLALDAAEEEESSDGVEVSSPIDYFDGKFNSRYYYEGDLYSGLFRFSESGKLYRITDGKGTLFNGTMAKSKYKQYLCDYELSNSWDNLLYVKGKIYTGVRASNLYYYNKGKKDTTTDGWKNSNGNTYYLQNGKATTGNKRIKRYGNTYRYTFRDNGSLVTDLFKYDSANKKKKMRVSISRSTFTATILLYNSDTDKYDIPAKSFVVSMSKEKHNTKPGTYRLTQRKRWWKYKAGLWYQYATYISGSGSWTHSEQYSKKSVRSLKTKSYNGLGTKQSKQCIRMQVVNCKLIYDLSKSSKYIRVNLNYSDSNIPFGKMTLNNNYDHEGKISTNYDPTDPAV